MDDASALKPNTEFGQYRILRLLGRGGRGEVYEVQHTTLGRSYALKLLPAEFAARPDALARFRREARVMANLNHPHIVRVDDFGETAGRYWLRMELVKGVETWGKAESGKQKAEIARCITLGEYAAQRGGQIAQEEFAGILHHMLEALACALDAGVVHRDLKPGNILLEPGASGPVVKVSDFGLARVVGDDFLRSQAQTTMSRSLSIGEAQTLGDEGTSTRALVGTWEYMAPEQRRGEEADARSDVYAMGLMCYRLLTGKRLGFKLPSELVPGLDAQWDGFVSGAVEQEAAARYANGREMLVAAGPIVALLQSVAEGHQTEAAQRQAEQAARMAAENQRRAAEIVQRQATEAARAREAEELRQRTAREQARREKLAQLREEQRLQAEQRMVKMAAEWGRLKALILSPLGVAALVMLVLGASCYWSIPAYRKWARNRAWQAQVARNNAYPTPAGQPRGGMNPAQFNQMGAVRQYTEPTEAQVEAALAYQTQRGEELDAKLAQLNQGAAASKSSRLRLKQALAAFTEKSPFVNSLGMKFVYVPGAQVLFCVWETRVKDYSAYAAVNSAVDGQWRSPGISQQPDHPVVNVNWADARAFCLWLTVQEQAEGKITAGQRYQLPHEAEWTLAAGGTKYPWGDEWPPPFNAGNYPGGMNAYRNQTSPAGSFAANQYGLYDLGGNVWEWCQGTFTLPGNSGSSYGQNGLSRTYGGNPATRTRNQSSPGRGTYPSYGIQNAASGPDSGYVLHGGSWRTSYNPMDLASSSRRQSTSTTRENDVGFRVVLAGEPAPETVLGGTPPQSATSIKETQAKTQVTGTPTKGQPLYEQNCAKCHGSDGKGRTKMGQKLGVKDYTNPGIQAALRDEMARSAIKQGVRDSQGRPIMKGFDEFSDQETASLIAYMRAFKR